MIFAAPTPFQGCYRNKIKPQMSKICKTYFVEEESEAQRGKVTCREHTAYKMSQPRFKISLSVCAIHALCHHSKLLLQYKKLSCWIYSYIQLYIHNYHVGYIKYTFNIYF